MPLALHSRVRLFCCAVHADPLPFKTLISWFKLITKNHLLYCTKDYIHRLLAYLEFLLNKIEFYQKATMKDRRTWLLIVQIIVSRDHMMHTQREMLYRVFTRSRIRRLVWPTPITVPTQLLKQPVRTQAKLLEKIHTFEDAHFTYFKWSKHCRSPWFSAL